jgi:hypothetical protein
MISPVMILVGLVFLVAVIVIITNTGKKVSHKGAGVVLDKEVYKEPEPIAEVTAVEVTYLDPLPELPVLTDKVEAPKAMKPAVKAKTAPRVQKSTKPVKAVPAAPAKKKKPKKSPKA